MPTLVLHHRNANPIRADLAKVNCIGETSHQGAANIPLDNHPPSRGRRDPQDLSFDLVYELAPKAWSTTFVEGASFFKLPLHRRVVLDGHRRRRAIISL